MKNKYALTVIGFVAIVAFAIGLSLAKPAQAQQQSPRVQYEAVYAGGTSGGAIDDARRMTAVLNERTAAGWRFVAASGSVLIFSK